MISTFYVSSTRINARIADLVMPGSHITVDGLTYEQLSRRPKGRSIYRKFTKEDNTESIIIYK